MLPAEQTCTDSMASEAVPSLFQTNPILLWTTLAVSKALKDSATKRITLHRPSYLHTPYLKRTLQHRLHKSHCTSLTLRLWFPVCVVPSNSYKAKKKHASYLIRPRFCRFNSTFLLPFQQIDFTVLSSGFLFVQSDQIQTTRWSNTHHIWCHVA